MLAMTPVSGKIAIRWFRRARVGIVRGGEGDCRSPGAIMHVRYQGLGVPREKQRAGEQRDHAMENSRPKSPHEDAKATDATALAATLGLDSTISAHPALRRTNGPAAHARTLD